ncbi:MAG: SWIM zinc finger family protein [Kaiparowitsia implicata GSE-PSE-MK54-09C]|jgi:uncharacterized Zn finger protein|nr:SWIM zinc finger family protein [Kaiparowitsia implicata GSE-PSE-MK54-09C]
MTHFEAQPSREWWAQRWVDVLESFGRIPRLARARNYAREGHVLSISFETSNVRALVQGTAPEPYRVSLHLDAFDDEQWQYVIESLAQQAVFSAKLLSGEMPHNIEEVFTENGLSLFPFTKFDIHSKCSCPDPANPCKHIGAVYYLLGDRFSEDPFVLFQLRGRTKDQIISALRHLRSAPAPAAPEAESEAAESEATAIETTEAERAIALQQFWQYDHQIDPSLVVIAPAPGSDLPLDILGNFPTHPDITATFSVIAPETIMDYLKTVYAVTSQAAVMTAMTAGTTHESN